jgi:hypothetical protein
MARSLGRLAFGEGELEPSEGEAVGGVEQAEGADAVQALG